MPSFECSKNAVLNTLVFSLASLLHVVAETVVTHREKNINTYDPSTLAAHACREFVHTYQESVVFLLLLQQIFSLLQH